MKRAFAAIMISAVLVFLTAPLRGETSNLPGASSKKTTENRLDGNAEKARIGVNNILFGWTDIPKSIIGVTRDSGNPVWGITGGAVQGIGKALSRTVSGISDVISSSAGNNDKTSVRPDELKTQLR